MNYLGFEQFGNKLQLSVRFEKSLCIIKCYEYVKKIMYSEKLFEEDFAEISQVVKKAGKKQIEILMDTVKKSKQ
jgi:hypothetical protein